MPQNILNVFVCLLTQPWNTSCFGEPSTLTCMLLSRKALSKKWFYVIHYLIILHHLLSRTHTLSLTHTVHCSLSLIFCTIICGNLPEKENINRILLKTMQPKLRYLFHRVSSIFCYQKERTWSRALSVSSKVCGRLFSLSGD